MNKPILIPTDVACAFILGCRNQQTNADTLAKAREHIYNLAKNGKLTRHGTPKRGGALWDLRELAKPYRNTTII